MVARVARRHNPNLTLLARDACIEVLEQAEQERAAQEEQERWVLGPRGLERREVAQPAVVFAQPVQAEAVPMGAVLAQDVPLLQPMQPVRVEEDGQRPRFFFSQQQGGKKVTQSKKRTKKSKKRTKKSKKRKKTKKRKESKRKKRKRLTKKHTKKRNRKKNRLNTQSVSY